MPPLWETLRVVGLFDADCDTDRVQRQLAAALGASHVVVTYSPASLQPLDQRTADESRAAEHRDTLYSHQSIPIQAWPTPFAGRFGGIRRWPTKEEALHRIVPLGEHQLRLVVREFMAHHHQE